jgi:predicted MPP superfamily phosphohydrolase
MIFNLVLFVCDAIVLSVVARHKKIGVALVLGVLVTVLAAVLAAVSAGSVFHFMRFAAFGIFLHAPVVLFGMASLWWRQRRRSAIGSALLAALLLLIAGDAFLIEPFWLDVSHREIVSAKIKRRTRIVVIADFQTDRFGEYEKRVLDEAMAQKPDVILWAGDNLQTNYEECVRLQKTVNEYLRQIAFSAPLGVYAVQGNIDCQDWEQIFGGLNVHTATYGSSFEVGGLTVTCLGLGESFSPRLSVKNPQPENFHIVLGHAPVFARGEIEADFLVAGHTHGGQVRIPFFGALAKGAEIPRAWVAGMTDLSGGRTLFVSRGVGMERDSAPRLRFLCRPELAVIDLVPGG